VRLGLMGGCAAIEYDNFDPATRSAHDFWFSSRAERYLPTNAGSGKLARKDNYECDVVTIKFRSSLFPGLELEELQNDVEDWCEALPRSWLSAESWSPCRPEPRSARRPTQLTFRWTAEAFIAGALRRCRISKYRSKCGAV